MMMTMRVVVVVGILVVNVVVSPPLEVTVVLVDDVVVNPPLKFRIPQLSRCRMMLKFDGMMTIAMMTN